MNLPRRTFLHLAASAAALPFAPVVARAQSYPSRPVRIIVPLPPGSTSDIVARLIGQWLTERLGQAFVVENRPGAGTNLGTEVVARAPADGHTLLSTGTSSAINATLYEKLSFIFLRDLAPIAGIMRVPNVMEIHPSVPAKTVPEFIAYAKANPGKLNMASSGNGSTAHVFGELFKMMAGVDLVHVPYRTGALTDLLAGHVQVIFDALPPSIEHIKAGKLRPLAVTTKERSEALPDIPSMSDFLPNYDASTWFGVCAPQGTSPEIIGKLNVQINAALADLKMKARLSQLGGDALSGAPSDFGKLIAEETDKWGKVIRSANIKPE